MNIKTSLLLSCSLSITLLAISGCHQSNSAPQSDSSTLPITALATTNTQNLPPIYESSTLEIVDSIKVEELYKYAISFKLLPRGNNLGLDIWYHDGKGLSINKFSNKGEHLNTIELPTIDEPIGLNRVSDFFVYNKDSIFVYDAEFRRLMLVNEQSEVLNLWLMNNYIPELSSARNNEIIDIYKNEQNELKIDLSGFANTYYQSDRNFFLTSTLVYQINLISKQVVKGIPYPENSAYRNQLFWSGTTPYVRKTENGYLAVFPLDEKIYEYSNNLEFFSGESTNPKKFPKAQGKKFGSHQKMDFARMDRKLNGFNLKVRGEFNTGQGKRFAKVYRAPLGDDDAIPDDYASFLLGDYKSKHYLQVFDMDGDRFRKLHEDIEISHMKLGNLLYIDMDNRYYFLKNDPESEEKVILICELSGERNLRLSSQALTKAGLGIKEP